VAARDGEAHEQHHRQARASAGRAVALARARLISWLPADPYDRGPATFSRVFHLCVMSTPVAS
jgi:hypothetical protein